MNAFQRFFSQVGGALAAMRHPKMGIGWFLLNRTSIDYENEVKPEASSIVLACLGWVQRTFSEAPPILEQWIPEREDWQRYQRDPVLDLLDTPNPYYNGLTLWKATNADLILTGSAYWIKVRSRSGRVVELWWAPQSMMEPKAVETKMGETPAPFISYYEYRPGSISPILIRVEDVVKFQDGMDPSNPRKGYSRMKALFREIFTDDEAANMTASLLRNMGIPGVIISPEEGTLNPEQAKKVKDAFSDKFTGDHKGEAMVMQNKTKVQQFGFSPEQMQLRSLRGIPEERITAVLGVNAAVVGLGAGLATTKVGAPQPLSATLWTPTGPITMGDARIGQMIATPSGWKPIKAVYPQGEQEIYRITFQDGSSAESTFDHLWQVQLPDKRHHKEVSVLPLSAIAAFPYGKLRRTTIPLQGVTEFEEHSTLIPPYIMGLLLGDGTFRHQLNFSNIAEEIIEEFRKELPAGYTLQHINRGDYRLNYDAHAAGRGVGNGSGNIHPMKDELRRLGLWMKYSREKFVPDLYKYNSSHVRREVLRGILDSDGFVNLHGQPALEQTSARLAEDVTFIVQSLGGYTLQHRKRANTNTRLIAGRPMSSKYDRYFQSIVIDDAASLFRFSEKRDRCRTRTKAATRKFRAIELVRREESQCISVDGGLYLTDNFIVTHNTLREYREEATESTIVPLWRELGSELTHQLLPDFRAGTDWRVAFDLSRVRVLQDDEDKRVTRHNNMLAAGAITIAEYRRALGIIALPEHEIYLRPTNSRQIPTGPLRLQTEEQPPTE